MEQAPGCPRVLMVRLGAMGDVLHALPAVALLRQALPGARIGWLVEQRWRELLCSPGTELAGPRSEQRPLVDEVHLADTRAWRKEPLRRDVRQQLCAAIGELRARRYAAALDLQGAIKSALLARLSGARIVVGFRQPRESLARLMYDRAFDAHGAHVIEQNCELIRGWLNKSGPPLPPAGKCAEVHVAGDPRLAPQNARRGTWGTLAALEAQSRAALLPRNAACEAAVADKLNSLGWAQHPLAILNPGAGWAAKQWAPERYGQLAKLLAARGLLPVINFGPGEETLASAVAAASQGAAQPLFTSISEFIALARHAQLFVGGDTGPMHLAALLGVKTVALFGPTDPARNGPYWPGARVLRDAASITSYSHKRTGDAGLEKLSVERVLAEIDSLLQG